VDDLGTVHDRLYDAATRLLKLDGGPPPHLNWFGRRRVRKAIRAFQLVVELKPENWAALWLMGKAYQQLRKHELAIDCFSRSRVLNQNNPDIAREAGISAMECGRADLAVQFTQAALLLSPMTPDWRPILLSPISSPANQKLLVSLSTPRGPKIRPMTSLYGLPKSSVRCWQARGRVRDVLPTCGKTPKPPDTVPCAGHAIVESIGVRQAVTALALGWPPA
jgi:tetratricopeptide (TPR) repeat protein